MDKSTLQIYFHKPGLHTTIQDLGRIGHQSFGVPVSGVMDEFSAKMANWLVGNQANTPLLEITLLGPKIEFKNDSQIALTGADLSPKINGILANLNETLFIKKGDIMSFGKVKSGCRSYLAIRGIWQVKTWLGSASYVPQNGSVLTPDSLIKKDHSISILSDSIIEKKILPKKLIVDYPAIQYIQVFPGPEFDSFSKIEIAQFFGQNHEITPDSNRMGYRLNTQLIKNQINKEIISSGIIPGTIQITSAGKAIILMKDAQTTGGYCRFLNVISSNLDKLGQMKPRDKIRFSLVGFD
ncbi:MAG: biotin-dependent carboxyltransferase family protein [Bacteroidetes bacterium]|jgi:antagonist of KipI|nr:biotin-dependent carboxyltransferase family protein [Bacteroidota bacterium]